MAGNLSKFVANLRSARDQNKNAEYKFIKQNLFNVKFEWDGCSLLDRAAFSDAPGATNLITPFSASKLDGTEENEGLISNIDFYVKKVDIPNIQHTRDVIKIGDQVGDNNPGFSQVILANALVTPQDYKLKIEFWDTEKSIVDNFIYPWMLYNASPRGYIPESLDDAAIKNFGTIMKGNFIIELKHPRYLKNPNNTGEMQYIDGVYRIYRIIGCHPVDITTPNVTNESTGFITRTVNFAFSKIQIENGPELDEPTFTEVTVNYGNETDINHVDTHMENLIRNDIDSLPVSFPNSNQPFMLA